MKELLDLKMVFVFGPITGGGAAYPAYIKLPKNFRIDEIIAQADFPVGATCLLRRIRPRAGVLPAWTDNSFQTLMASGTTFSAINLNRKLDETIRLSLFPNGTDDTTFTISFHGTRYQ